MLQDGYAHMDQLQLFYLRRMTGVDIQDWWVELRNMQLASAEEDALLLWDLRCDRLHIGAITVYHREMERTGYGEARKVLRHDPAQRKHGIVHRERWRRWNRFLGRHGVRSVPFALLASSRLPDVFHQQAFCDGGIEPYIRFFAALRFGRENVSLIQHCWEDATSVLEMFLVRRCISSIHRRL